MGSKPQKFQKEEVIDARKGNTCPPPYATQVTEVDNTNKKSCRFCELKLQEESIGWICVTAGDTLQNSSISNQEVGSGRHQRSQSKTLYTPKLDLQMDINDSEDYDYFSSAMYASNCTCKAYDAVQNQMMAFQSHITKSDMQNSIVEFLKTYPNIVCLMFNYQELGDPDSMRYSGSLESNDLDFELHEMLQVITTNAPQIIAIKVDLQSSQAAGTWATWYSTIENIDKWCPMNRAQDITVMINWIEYKRPAHNFARYSEDFKQVIFNNDMKVAHRKGENYQRYASNGTRQTVELAFVKY